MSRKAYATIVVVRCLVVIAAVVTAGCETALTFEQMRHSRGTGSTEVYDADIDALWKVIPKAVAESGLIVAGDNKDEGYVLAEKIEWTVKKVFLGSDQRRATVDRAVIFVKPHNRGTLVEVIATGSTSSGIDYALASGAGNETNHDRELSILRTIGRLLQVQTRESNPD